MPDDFEQDVRDMLRTRACDIANLGSEPLPDSSEISPAGPRRLLRLLAVAAVVLVMLAIAGVVATVRRDHTDHGATPPTLPPSPSTPAAIACRGVPASWPKPVGVRSVPVTFLPDGTVVTTRYGPGQFSVSAGSTVVYRVAREYYVVQATTDGHWLVLALRTLPNPTNDGLSSIVLVDLRSRTSRVLGPEPEYLSEGAVLFEGAVYWADLSRIPVGHSWVVRYDPATGRQTTESSDGVRGLFLSGAGLQWRGQPTDPVQLPAILPAVVRRAVGPTPPANSLVTDGVTYAWRVSVNEYGWWQPGLTAPKLFGLRSQVPASGELGVAGPLIVVDRAVIDARTGASAPWSIQLGTAAYGQLAVSSDTLEVIGDYPPYAVLDTRHLAPLRC